VPSTAEELLYWIVQPLWKGNSWGPGRDGFGKFFTRPGMSRSEFESPGGDLRRLYQAAGGAPVIKQYQITAPPTSRPVYFVGPDIAPPPLPQSPLEEVLWDAEASRTLPAKARAMEVWLRSGGETKMPCWFAEFFHGSTDELPKEWKDMTIAWWAMQQDLMFTLDPTVAENLVKAILLEAETHAAFGDEGWA
jgi:hypothetical protein